MRGLLSLLPNIPGLRAAARVEKASWLARAYAAESASHGVVSQVKSIGTPEARCPLCYS